MKSFVGWVAACLVLILLGMPAAFAAGSGSGEPSAADGRLQTLLASTTEDYDGDRVLNLDSSKSTNFAVIKESTVYIRADRGINDVLKADREAGRYEIGNADGQITGLRPGTAVIYPYGDKGLMIGKVVSVVLKDDGTATVTLEPVEPEAVFSQLKLELFGDAGSAAVDIREALPGVSCRGNGWETEEFGLRTGSPEPSASRIELLLRSVCCPGSDRLLSGVVGLETETALNWYVTDGISRLDWTVKAGVAVDLEVSGSGSQILEIPLGTLEFSFGNKIGAVTVKPVLRVQAPQDGDLVMNRMEYVFGFSLEGSVNGDSPVPVFEWYCEPVNPEGTEPVLVGLDMAAEVKLKEGALLEACLDGGISNALSEETALPEPGTEHLCADCFDGQITVAARLGASVELLNRTVAEPAILREENCKIGDFYVCPEHGGVFPGVCPDVRERMPGDIDGSGKLNNKDVILLMQYMAGWDVDVAEGSADIDGNGKLNNKDVILLMQYMAGWNVEIR